MSEQRVRAINAPWPVLALIAVLIGAFVVQSFLGVQPIARNLGFEPDDLLDGRVDTLILSIFLHGGWAHLATNAAFALAFATPVSLRMGEDARGAVAFFVFFLACGILGNVGYSLLSFGSGGPAVGASGAVAGMMGAPSRRSGAVPQPAGDRHGPVLAGGEPGVRHRPGGVGAGVGWRADRLADPPGRVRRRPVPDLAGAGPDRPAPA